MKGSLKIIRYIFFLITLLVPSLAHNIEQEFIKSRAGVIIALPNTFFDTFTVQLIDSLESRMLSTGFSLGSFRKQTVDLRFTKATFLIAENKLSGLQISKNNTNVGFYEETSQAGDTSPSMNLQVEIKNVSFDYGLKYKIETDPDYFDDQGTGKLSVQNMSLTMRFSVHTKDGRAQFEVNDTIVDLEDYQAEFKGSHEFADGVTIVLDAFKPVFKKEILIMATRKISKLL